VSSFLNSIFDSSPLHIPCEIKSDSESERHHHGSPKVRRTPDLTPELYPAYIPLIITRKQAQAQAQGARTNRAPPSNSTSTSAPPNKSISGVCDAISRMWSGWTGCDNQAATNGSASHQPYQSDPTDCKACREWHVPCDHTRPQCDHCYQQQLLCFYTNPNQPKPKPKTKKVVHFDSVPRIREPTPRKRLN